MTFKVSIHFNMVTTALIFLAAVYGFTQASEECETPVLQFCEIHDYNFDAPTTKDELASLCKNGKQALECVISVFTKCQPNEKDLRKLLEIQSNVESLCDENNIVYQVVYDNIECIGSALASAFFGCPQSVEKGMNRVITEKGIALHLTEQSRCSNSLYLLSCHIIHTRRLCGKLPADAVLEIFKIFHLPIYCGREIAAELSTIVDNIALVEGEEAGYENVFRKK